MEVASGYIVTLYVTVIEVYLLVQFCQVEYRLLALVSERMRLCSRELAVMLVERVWIALLGFNFTVPVVYSSKLDHFTVYSQNGNFRRIDNWHSIPVNEAF